MNRQRYLSPLLYSLVALLFLALAPPVHSQVDTGAILGTIKDKSGAVVPNARVTLTNEGTNFSLVTTSGADGNYTFTPLRIGNYRVAVEASGFSKETREHIAVNIQQQVVVDFTLSPGQVTQTVEVTAAAPLLQTQNGSVGHVVNSKLVNDLPLNGRNFTFLAQIVSGAQTPQADTRGNAASGAFSTNGLQPAQNNYLLDGIDNNSNAVDFLNGTNFVVLPPVDAVQEFKVETANYSAQYGRSGGAVLNATIKSGTNSLHGDLWEFLRNDKLDSADFFENAGGRPKGVYRQNQYGFSVGGPVVIPHLINGRNKMFFFGDYEGLKRRQGTVFSVTVPTALERSSGFTNFAEIITSQAGTNPGSDPGQDLLGRIFPTGTVFDPATTRPVTVNNVDPVTGITAKASGYVRDPFYTGASVLGITDFTGLCPSVSNCQLNQIPVGRIDPNAVKLLDLYPAPNSSGASNYTNSPVLKENRNAFDTRVDYDMSEHDQIFTRVSFVDDPQFIPGPFSGFADGGAFQQGNQTATSWQGPVTWTHVFTPAIINEARVGFSYIHTTRIQANGNVLGGPAQFGILGVPQVAENGGLPGFNINGLATIGSNQFLPSDEISSTVQITDDFTQIHGSQTWKTGFEIQHVKFSTLQPVASRGTYSFGGNFTRIPQGKIGTTSIGGQSDNTGIAQLVLLPTASSVPNGINDVGGANQLQLTNMALTDDGHNYAGVYFEDDWKVNTKLTLNLGLRWDFFGQIFENHGREANFVPGLAPSEAGSTYLIPQQSQAIQLSPSFLSLMAKDGIGLTYYGDNGLTISQDKNFAPRFGFAYQLSPALVVRGGFGIFYGGFENLGYGPNIGANYPFTFQFTYPLPDDAHPVAITNPDGTTCTPAITVSTGFSCTPLDPALVNAKNLTLRGWQYNWKTAYTQGYNFAVQYQIRPSLAASLAYVGNGVRHLPVSVGANAVSQIQVPGQNVQNFRPFHDFAGAGYIASEGNSNYNGLQFSLQKQYTKGLTLLGGYTWSKTRTDAGDLLNGGSVGGYRAPYLPGFGIQQDYRLAPFDVTHVVHFSGAYDLPFGQGRSFLDTGGPVNAVLGGWSMQWIATMQGGQPLTIGCTTGTTTGLGCNAFLVPGQSPAAGPHNVNQFLNPAAFANPPAAVAPAVGQLPSQTDFTPLGGSPTQTRGPGFDRLDYSMFKNFQLSERYRLQFRGEFFNVLNHPNFNAPGFGGNGVVAIPNSLNFKSTNFGKIGSTRDAPYDPRQIQFALKLYF